MGAVEPHSAIMEYTLMSKTCDGGSAWTEKLGTATFALGGDATDLEALTPCEGQGFLRTSKL